MASSDESDGDYAPPAKNSADDGGLSDADSEDESPRTKDDDADDDDEDFGDSEDEEAGSIPVAKGKKSSSKSLKKKGKKDKRGKKDKKGKGKKRKRNTAAASMFDDEAEESDRGGGSGGSDDEDDDDEENEYRMDGFVVGDDELSEGEIERQKERRRDSSKRKRLRKAREDGNGMEVADDEDLELIREAQGASEARDHDRNELVASDGQDLRNQLFNEADDDGLQMRRQEPYGRSQQARGDDFNSDDDSDFIVDDLGTHGQMRRSSQQQESFRGGVSGPSQEQVYEAMQIFGEGIQDFDFMKGDEDGEDGEGDGKLSTKDARRKALAGIEPSILKEKFLLDSDKTIQETDRPERLQLRMPARGEASDEERRDEANWICNQLDLGYNADETMAQKAVEHVLRFLGVESQEVPFIWHYRRDYLWTGPSTYLTRDHLWKIYDLDETWDKVGNRREKVAKASGALWKLMDGDDGSDNDDDEGYSSETPDDRDVRLAGEETAKETRDTRLRRAEQAAEKAKSALELAEEHSVEGSEEINNKSLSEAQAKKMAAANARREAGEMVEDGAEEVVDGDWERVTDESLAKALEDAKDSFKHATSYVIGLKGELAVEEDEEKERNEARLQRRRERKEADQRERQKKRDEARKAMEEEASLFPSEQYAYLLNSQEEMELKDMQEYLALVSLQGEAEEKLRAAALETSHAKRPRRPGRADDNLYRAARQAGLRGLANKFSITAAQLGEVISGVTMARYDVPTPVEPADLVASDMAGASDTPLFESSESILRGVRHILAREIATEPRVKAKCRQTYRRYAMVSTNPTARGLEEIDAFHPLYGLHYLNRKNLSDFFTGEDRTQWLKIEKGKAEGLLTYTIHPPERTIGSMSADGRMVEKRELDNGEFLKLLNPVYNPEGGGVGGLDGVSVPVKQGWDYQRNLVLNEALVDNLLPALETELALELKAAARAAVVDEASRAFARRLAVGPFERAELTTFQKIVKADNDLKYDQVRVMGIYVSTDPREESWAVAVDPSGSVLDHLQIPYGRDNRATKIKAFIKSARPHVVCVSTSAGQACRSLMDLLVDRRSGQNGEPRRGVVADAHREYKEERGDYDDDEEEEDMNWKEVSVAFVKDDVAGVFARSSRGEKEFKEFTINQRTAVGVARYLQDPLIEFAGMWTTMDTTGHFGGETFSLKLHPLQDEVPPQQLLRVWSHRLMDAVSDVGVDINHAAEHEHAMGVLQFVPGLGPRKAAKLRERIGPALGGVVPSRKALLSSQLLKSLVYTNAAGFLRVRERGKLAERLDGQVDPFDDTRVHPECYNTQDWAQRICANALDVQVDDDYFPIVESAMDDSREALQRYCSQDPAADPRLPLMNLNDSVNELDLSAYADELEKQGEGKRALQLDSIVEEIRYPYRDRRQPYTPPSEDELFEWLTGETDATLREGVLVPVRVTKHNDAGVRVRLEGGPGLFGFVPADYVTDDVLPQDPITGQVASLSTVVKTNQLMEAAIIKVDKTRFELKLSLRKSDTQPNPEKWDEPVGAARVFGAAGWMRPHTLPRLDAKFDVVRAKQDARDRIKNAQKKALERIRGATSSSGTRAAGVRFPRTIMHPQYKNFTHIEAEEYLKEISSEGRGEALIRPSSKGPDHLSLTWMWMEGEFMHTDIRELGKQPGAMLAPRLKIKNEEYEDLDEIFSRRVSACNDLVDDLVDSKKYESGTVEEVEAKLRAAKAEEPNRIPYFLCRRGSPGYVNLMYLPGNTIKKEVVEVSPEGYVLSKRCFKTLPELFKWFKNNAQMLGRSHRSSSSRKDGHRSRHSGHNSNGAAAQPPLPPGPEIPPPPPPPASDQQQYPAYNGGAYGYQGGYYDVAAGGANAYQAQYAGYSQQPAGADPQNQWYNQQQQQQLYQQQYQPQPQGGQPEQYDGFAQQGGFDNDKHNKSKSVKDTSTPHKSTRTSTRWN